MFRPMFALTVLLAGSLLSQSAHAYVVKGTGWKEPTVTFHVDPALDDAIPGATTALNNAVATWEAEGDIPSIELQKAGSPVARDAQDKTNVVVAYTEGWPFESNLLAATVVVRGNLDKHLQSADVYINRQHHVFGDGEFDLQSTLTHELGHALDLGDEDHAFSAAMYRKLAPGVLKHAITDDDRKGISEIYANATKLGCAQGNVAPPMFMLLLLVGVVRRRKNALAAAALLGVFMSFAPAEADADGALLAFSDVDGVAGAVQGTVESARTIAVQGAPLPMTELTLKDAACVAGTCATTRTITVWGGVRDDGKIVELADQPVPEAGEEILVRMDAHGRSVQRHGASIAFMGRDLLGASVAAVGDRLSWTQHKTDDVVAVLQRALGK